WGEQVVAQLEAYSRMTTAQRPEALQALREALRKGPAGAPTPVIEPVVPPPAPVVAQPSTPSPQPRPTARGAGLAASVTTLSGVGEKRAELLEKLGVRTVRELLYCYPRRYEDYSQLKTIDQLRYGETVSVVVTVWEAGLRQTRSGQYLFQALLSDHTGTLHATWFNQRYLEGRIKPGMQIVVSGKVDQYLGNLQLNSPAWEPLDRKDLSNARIIPIYPLTEGLTQRWMRVTLNRALAAWAGRAPDNLPESLRLANDLLPLSQALRAVHFPDSMEQLTAARRRLAFEEALYLQLGLLQQKRAWKSQEGRQIEVVPEYRAALVETLPYTLTAAQQRALDEMSRDLASGEPMHRLLQGDVGAGKTVVAALLMAFTAAAGSQSALMAPTEILAEQHYHGLARFFDQFPESRPTVRLLTGSTPAAEREEIYAGFADGTIHVAVGTHALIQEQVRFQDLALVVIDEQHRFGVEQRAELRGKGYNPHLLVMTATPIPRSLELTVWGHLDVSVLDELPPGRQPIKTRVLYPHERERAYAFIRDQVAQGRQAFIIYPLVEESEKIAAPAAVAEHARLQEEIFPDLRLGLLHGRLRSADKDAIMSAFARGELDILVATSVVEVGIDVPNATVMLIEGAERFGLAQLHQFRGRVGRGEHQSYCLLLAGEAEGAATERLQAVEATTDGFVLAQKDLEMRGPGEFLGTRQSGFPEMPMLSLLTDTRLLHRVREVAAQLLDSDPELRAPEHAGLAERVAELWQQAEEAVS
ncbi:MAG TPA: ATP-dependent DNA helicase RecG, partial [Chloroflexi bacterium]|nr:ATP-dependent DNA helicase RecG [Chloroflexota bacterium]